MAASNSSLVLCHANNWLAMSNICMYSDLANLEWAMAKISLPPQANIRCLSGQYLFFWLKLLYSWVHISACNALWLDLFFKIQHGMSTCSTHYKWVWCTLNSHWIINPKCIEPVWAWSTKMLNCTMKWSSYSAVFVYTWCYMRDTDSHIGLKRESTSVWQAYSRWV